ncbi:beta-1,4 N-acetylgalactosaminyltransferase 2 isoform X2 [Sceloporus undulatus]|uniref:beta-1,4 N-acetylgalactosaminyltransferase 2 isoform X2 n=1 Tax=Sceloporus undulatus TaxID=8520 RepID=UPI001C4C148B|nr:beta-1,4 N-acetylgalactosaminyltransferase 2 isoform X2 [Sceloporus undulatus]
MLRYKYFYGPILCLAILTYLLIYKGKGKQVKQEWESPEASSFFKLLPEEKYKSMFLYNGIWLGPKNHCECAKSSKLTVYQLDDYIDKEKLASVTKRREKEFKDYQKRYSYEKKDVLVAQPNIPLSYPIQGAEVMPLHTIIIPGLGFHGENAEKQKVLLEASFGTLDTLADVPNDTVHGRGKKKLTISTSDVELLNHILKHITYTSTEYLLDAVDFVNFVMETHHVRFPVTIRQPRMPKLYDPGPDNNIRNLVTITTKTFFRYHKLRVLIKSIRKYYPDITIIVADDSEHPEKIQEPNVEHFIMPFAKGWFAGRNLAISQVTTKYYLWVDDDFLFTENTKIEEFVAVLENSNLDVVGGSVKGNDYKFQLIYEEGEGSSCLHLRFGSYHRLEGFPHCVVTSGVVNFFLARTEETRSIGFDPKLLRVAHSEYFIDGLGVLRVGSCSHLSVDHQPHESANNLQERNVEQRYNTFRTRTQKDTQFKLALQFFKNRMKCFTKG